MISYLEFVACGTPPKRGLNERTLFFSLPVCSPPPPPPFLALFSRAYPIHQASLFQIGTLLSLSLSLCFSRKEEGNGLVDRREGRSCSVVLDSTCIFSSDQRIIAVERQPDGVCRLIARQRRVSLRVTCRGRRANRSARLRSAPLCPVPCE